MGIGLLTNPLLIAHDRAVMRIPPLLYPFLALPSNPKLQAPVLNETHIHTHKNLKNTDQINSMEKKKSLPRKILSATNVIFLPSDAMHFSN